MASVAEIKARMQAKRDAQAKRRAEAELADWEAYEAAAEQYGIDAVARITLPRFVEGLPTFLVVRAAPADHMRIFRQRSLKARQGKGGQLDLAALDRNLGDLGKACIVYPAPDGVAQIKAEFPSVEKDAGAAAKDLAEAEAEIEGKEQ